MSIIKPNYALAVRQPWASLIIYGGIIGMVDLDSPWFVGPYGFVLANPRPLPFFKVDYSVELLGGAEQ